jgi:hypothetical protein
MSCICVALGFFGVGWVLFRMTPRRSCVLGVAENDDDVSSGFLLPIMQYHVHHELIKITAFVGNMNDLFDVLDLGAT